MSPRLRVMIKNAYVVARPSGHAVRLRRWARQGSLYLTVLFFLVLTFAPLAVMVFMSFRSNAQIYSNFWGLPDPWLFSNYMQGFTSISRFTVNSVVDSLASVGLVVVLASLSGYVFARQRFPGKEILYLLILALLMIPGILTLIPSFVLMHQLGIWNTPLALILPWAAGGQVLGIFLCRGFIAGLPEELFEAGRIDGASEFQLWYLLAVPLTLPILMTIAILTMVSTYNDYIWPLLVISDSSLQVVSVGLTQFTDAFGVTDYGPQMAAYVVASVPLLVVFMFGMKYFIQGITTGAIKA
jgi:ABC-type glycerol-3-phosphate transport system permease component